MSAIDALRNSVQSMFTVRAPLAADAGSVERIMTSCTSELRAVYAPKPRAKIAPISHSSPGLRVVAVDHTNTVVGVAEYIAQPLALYVQGIAVAPTHRRRGIAGILLDRITALAVDMRLPSVQVATVKETGNVEVFKRLGFAATEERTSERFVDQHGQPVTEVTLKRPVASPATHSDFLFDPAQAD